MKHIIPDDRGLALLEAYGLPYYWAEGAPNTPWLNNGKGYDCSGFAQGALVKLGALSPKEPDRNAFSLAMICDKVEPGQERLGDLAFYGKPITHVMVVVGPHWVIGATGGTSKTKGDSARAYVRLERLHYRNDLLVIGRLKPKYNQGGLA